jgi:hypothetical protein
METMTETLPPRGYASIDSTNRGLVRKWLTAQGATYSQIGNLTVSQLSAAYNDESNEALNAILDGQTAPQAPAPAPQTRQTIAAPASASADTAAALDALLRSLTPQSSPIDRDEIVRIIREEAAGMIDEKRIVALIAEHAPQSPQTTVFVEGAPQTRRELPAGLRHCAFPIILQVVAFDSVFLAGPAGAGKTTIAEQCAEALDTPFYFTGAVGSEYKLTGFVDAQGRTVRTAFREAFEHGGLFLFDEIDASDPAALLAFNSALSNGKFDFPDGSVKRHPNFRCIASANTWGGGASREYVGRNQLDAATLDRFARIAMDYDPQLENLIAGALHKHGEAVAYYVQELRAAARRHSIRHVISPRATYRTCKALRAEIPLCDALNLSLEGMDADSRARLDSETSGALHSLSYTLNR